MEKIIIFFILSMLSVFFGLIGKKITFFEKNIYKNKFYFPLFISILTITNVLFLFINLKMSILFFSFSLIALSWYL